MLLRMLLPAGAPRRATDSDRTVSSRFKRRRVLNLFRLENSLSGTVRYLVLMVALVLGPFVVDPPGQICAQEFRATVTGEVTDPTGAAIPGASITAVNVESGVANSATTNSEGIYSVLYILPGTYTVTVKATGFQAMVYSKVVLNSAQQMGLNVSLKAGSVTQQVVVTAGPVDLDTVSATTGGVIDQVKVEAMPSSGLMVWDDIGFTEGIRIYSPNAFNQTPRNNVNVYAVSGAQTDENAFYMNGAPVSDQGNWYFTPNQESVQQIQASAFPYDAQYARTGGGAFSTDVKDGTNQYHGAIYEYFGNKVLNANTWFNDLTGIKKAVNNRNVWGAESGGPIRKDKMFYFASYEGFDQAQPGTITDTVPTTGATGEASGNFSQTPYTIYDPSSTYCAQTNSSGGCTTYARKPFPNNTIPPQDINPIGKAILALYPVPTNSALTNNYIMPSNLPIYQYEQGLGRLDLALSARTRLYGLYTHEDNYNENPGNGIQNAASTAVTNTGTNYNAILDLTHIFSATKVLDLKASYGHTTTLAVTGKAIAQNFTADKLGFNMPAVGTTSHQNIVPSMTITGATALFGNTANGLADADADFSGTVTQLLGRHNLHYGAEFMDIQTAPTGVLGNPNGSFTFNSAYTQQNPLKATTGTGNEFADILLGYPSSGSIAWNEPTFITVHYYGAFIQDDFKVLPGLSLNLGLRWDVNTSPRDRHNRINDGFCVTCTNPYSSQVNFAGASGLQPPLLGGLQFAGVNGAPSGPYQIQWNDWQPRFGFSWMILRSMVIRGGYGIYFPWQSLTVDDIGFSQSTSYIATLPGAALPGTPNIAFKSGTPYPNGAVAPAGATGGLETNAGNAITFQDLNRRLRMTQHWSFGVQRKVPGSMLVDIEYMGTNVHRIPIASSLGVVSTAQQQACNASGATCNIPVANPFYGILPATSSLGASSTIAAWELMRAYPLFNGVTEGLVPAGSSHYNALDARVERRVRNLNFVFNYTYSNWMDRDSYLNNGSFRDANPTTELDPGDRRNYFDVDLVLPLPNTSRTGVLGTLANGWLFDSLALWGTGNPLQLPSGAQLNGTTSCTSYAPAGGQTRAHWFNNNESCWTVLGPWQPQTTPLHIGFIRDPAYMAWNAGFQKEFKFPREGMSARFLMQAVNAANHPTWGAPSTAIATPPAFSPTTSWTGFGTLPTGVVDNMRQIIASLKISF